MDEAFNSSEPASASLRGKQATVWEHQRRENTRGHCSPWVAMTSRPTPEITALNSESSNQRVQRRSSHALIDEVAVVCYTLYLISMTWVNPSCALQFWGVGVRETLKMPRCRVLTMHWYTVISADRQQSERCHTAAVSVCSTGTF